MMSDIEHIQEGLREYDYMYYDNWDYPDIVSKEYIEYEPYLYLGDKNFFNVEHNSHYKLKEAC